MQKLTKRDRKRFDDVSKKIRAALHLEHWEAEYTIEDGCKRDDERRYAEHRSFVEGRRVWVAIFPAFWTLDAEKQLTTLIHEHLHALMQTQDQHVYKFMSWLHDADHRAAESMFNKGNEHVVDHLTSVLYDLLKDRF